MISRCGSNIKSPHKLVVIVGLEKLRLISNQKSCIDLLLDDQLPFMDVFGVSFF